MDGALFRIEALLSHGPGESRQATLIIGAGVCHKVASRPLCAIFATFPKLTCFKPALNQ